MKAPFTAKEYRQLLELVHLGMWTVTGYQGEDTAAEETLKRALQLDSDHSEARIYLGNLLYDREEFEAASQLPSRWCRQAAASSVATWGRAPG